MLLMKVTIVTTLYIELEIRIRNWSGHSLKVGTLL